MNEKNASIFGLGILEGTSAFVTGGGTGIGFGIAKTLGALGANVTIASRRQEVLDKACAELSEAGVRALGIVCDVRDHGSVKRAVDQSVEKFGGLDILVNNAAGNFACPTEDLSPNGWRTVVDIDLNGTFNCCHAAFPHLSKSPHVGRIVSIITAYAWGGWPGCAPAAAAKAGIQSLMRTLAIEWAPKNIISNTVAPGPIADTEGTKRIHEDTDRAAAELARVPVGRFGEVEEIAAAVAYLVSPAARYVNGTDLVVDGGRQFKATPRPDAK
ncbi:SDR family oxidoreductase [Rhodopseudomonas boonkerdii]|jgi:NAD(P)-dependent dehydrogenase (short-subunit alcohol dehydrogenase family)|uniref:SDR family oxidoreductase n=1 Tax=Rhodopseudomonas boonkerdii TaxID=475937 RepID=UPI001E32604D|nr:SDR family oxidoreductase [Rhodopseudomonas boonkerdii]UGV28640.1 SDR family oxidoreductase [Rhodopseudomonas boonkerdii]